MEIKKKNKNNSIVNDMRVTKSEKERNGKDNKKEKEDKGKDGMGREGNSSKFK